jgi:uncharacterized protein (TIGR04222 family)
MTTRFVLAVLISLVATPALAEKEYSADRYDSHIEVRDDGSLRVTETIAIRFESGAFQQFYRAIPVRRTDGVEVVSASMDGATLPRGTGPGQMEISGSSNVRVTWHFAPLSDSTHIFELTYVARGVARQDQDADVVEWRILPTEHNYRIASSTIELILPARPARVPSIETQRVGDSYVDIDGGHIRITATSIRNNGWLQAAARLPRGTLITSPPRWQRQQSEINRLSRVWVIAAAIVVLLGLGVLFFIRQQYDPPARDFATIQPIPVPPDVLPPVIAGTLVANGSARLEHAMAALFSLADRGELRIDEQSRMLGQRQFAITRTASQPRLTPYETTLLAIIFGTDDPHATVSLGKARNRLLRQFRKFKAALEPAMQAAGLLDPDRQRVRRRFMGFAISCLLAAGLASIGFALLIEPFGPWPMLISLALTVVGLASLISAAAHTPLSNDGVRRLRDWRGFRQYLRDLVRDRQPSPGEAALGQMLPFAIALGMAHSWSSYLKRHRYVAPEWFRAVSAADNNSGAAFSAFVASGGMGHGGGAHGAAGGAAGGGASGAS